MPNVEQLATELPVLHPDVQQRLPCTGGSFQTGP